MLKVDTVFEPWTCRDVLAAYFSANERSVQVFRSAFGNYLGVDQGSVTFYKSAREGLTALLCAKFARNEGVVFCSAFNCSVVADAINNSGMKPAYFDVGRDGKFPWDEILYDVKRQKAAAIIIPHLFGVSAATPNDLKTFKQAGITVIEDCSHTLGATVGGEMMGSIGDFAIFSFNYDKPISLGGGGCVINRSCVALDEPGVVSDRRDLFELLIFRNYLFFRRCGHSKITLLAKLLRRSGRFIFWLLKRCRLSSTEMGFPVTGIGPVRATLGLRLLRGYESIRRVRNHNARRLLGACSNDAWSANPNGEAAWVKLRLKLGDSATKTLSKEALKRGLRVGNFNWPKPLGNSQTPEARRWAFDGVDIPVHQYLTEEQLSWLEAKLVERTTNRIKDA